MSLSYDEDQRDFAAAIAQLIEQRASIAHTREIIEGRESIETATWAKLNETMGLTALPVSEELGGQGATWAEVGIVFEALGRSLYPTPYLSIMTAIRLLGRYTQQSARMLVQKLAEGSTVPLVGFARASSFTLRDVGAGEVAVSGTSGLLPFHEDAEFALLEVRTSRGASLVLAPVTELQVVPAPTIDLTRPMCTITAENAPAVVIVAESAADDLSNARNFLATAVAVESIGGAGVCLDLATKYTREREQFGKAIGSFQGIKHLMADLLRTYEPAKSAAYAAMDAASGGDLAAFTKAASIAKYVTDRMYANVAVECVQAHGAIGFTWEFDLHLHYKRAIANRVVGLRGREQRDVIKDLIRGIARDREEQEVSA